MKASYEDIVLDGKLSSFHCFKIESNGFQPYWHYHKHLEITCIEQGEGIRFVGDNMSQFSDGDLVVLGEYIPHQWVSSKNRSMEIQKAHVVQFEKEIFHYHKEFSDLQELFDRAAFGIYFEDLGGSALDTLQKMHEANPYKKFILLLELLHEMKYSKKSVQLSSRLFNLSNQSAKSISRINVITQHILEKFKTPLNLDEISSLSHMTPPSFCRWFKKSTGMSFTKYLNSIRVEKAAEELINSDHPVSVIAFENGFESISNFNRTFKIFKHKSPSDFRSEMRPRIKPDHE